MFEIDIHIIEDIGTGFSRVFLLVCGQRNTHALLPRIDKNKTRPKCRISIKLELESEIGRAHSPASRFFFAFFYFFFLLPTSAMTN
jgi:hypothetical protein